MLTFPACHAETCSEGHISNSQSCSCGMPHADVSMGPTPTPTPQCGSGEYCIVLQDPLMEPQEMAQCSNTPACQYTDGKTNSDKACICGTKPYPTPDELESNNHRPPLMLCNAGEYCMTQKEFEFGPFFGYCASQRVEECISKNGLQMNNRTCLCGEEYVNFEGHKVGQTLSVCGSGRQYCVITKGDPVETHGPTQIHSKIGQCFDTNMIACTHQTGKAANTIFANMEPLHGGEAMEQCLCGDSELPEYCSMP